MMHPLAQPVAATIQQLRELSYAWAKSRDSVRAALAMLMSDPAQRLYYRLAPLASTRRRSGIMLWVKSLMCFS
jgi:hypothetical protein